MEENKNLVAALQQQLEQKEKEYKIMESLFHTYLDECVSLETELNLNYKASNIGRCIAEIEHPIVINGVKIDRDNCHVLSQGRVYSLYYDEEGESKKLYFAPKAYYPAERLLECYFVIGTKGVSYSELFIPERIHGCKYYNSMEQPLPNWAQQRDCMIALDFGKMSLIPFQRIDEMEKIKAIVKQINSNFRLLDFDVPGMRRSFFLRLVLPEYERLKKKLAKNAQQ